MMMLLPAVLKCQQRVQVTAKGYEQPNHEGNEQEKKDEDNG